MTPTAPALSTSRQVLGLVGWITLTFVAAAVGAWGSADSREFYGELVRPAWAPPGWLFGPVWTVLYASMAVSAWWVWRRRGFASARTALTLYVVQLAANALWSWLFFAWRQGGLAFGEVLVLWCLIVGTIVSFHRISTFAAVLLYPYLAWSTFAAALTYAVWQRNPGAL